MSLPLTLNSRTFVRNMKPYTYPPGTAAGMDWKAAGGVYDSTDPRNLVYWGPPRPLNGYGEFALLAGETPTNAVRRLKMDGYIGLYSARAEAERKRQEEPEPVGPSFLDRLAEVAAESRGRHGLTVIRPNDGGGRLSRAEQRALIRRGNREAAVNGFTPRVPALVAAGEGYLSDSVEDEEDYEDGGDGGDAFSETSTAGHDLTDAEERELSGDGTGEPLPDFDEDAPEQVGASGFQLPEDLTGSFVNVTGEVVAPANATGAQFTAAVVGDALAIAARFITASIPPPGPPGRVPRETPSEAAPPVAALPPPAPPVAALPPPAPIPPAPEVNGPIDPNAEPDSDAPVGGGGRAAPTSAAAASAPPTKPTKATTPKKAGAGLAGGGARSRAQAQKATEPPPA